MKLIVEELGRQVTYEIGPADPVVVGRGLENAIPIRDTKASRSHCRFTAEGAGARVEDLGSKNGTLINGKRLKEARALVPGDRIEIGDVKIWFAERPAGTAEAPEAAAEAHAPSTPSAASAITAERKVAAADLFSDDETDEALPKADEATEAATEAAREAPAQSASAPADPAVAPKGRYSLVAAEGELAGKKIEIERFPCKFGRTKKNQVVIHDGGVSGEHAEIVSRGDGCALVDLGSTNGTKVNGAKVKRAVLTDGSRIAIGTSVFVFHDAEKAAPETEAGKAHPSEVVLGKQGGAGRAPAAKAPGAAPTSKAAPAKPISERTPAAKPAPEKPAAPALVAPKAVAAKPTPAPPPRPAAKVAESPANERDPLADSDPAAPAVETAPVARANVREAEAPAMTGAPLEEDALGAAAADLGKSTTAAAIESSDSARPWGAIALSVVAVAVLAAAGIFLRTALLPTSETPADLDPSPRGNRIANWSFEGEPSASGAPLKWSAESGTLTVDSARGAGGRRSAVLTPAPGALAQALNATEVPAVGRDIQLRCQVRGGPAVAALVWESAADPEFRLVSTTDIVESVDWTDVQATFRAPAGADRARVAILAVGETAFDRVAVAEREASTGRSAAARVAAPGVTARLDERGVFELTHDDRPVFDRGGLALVGEGPLASLARQDAANQVATLRAKVDKKKRDPRLAPEQQRAPRAAGAILRPDGGGRASFVQEVEAVDGAIEVRYRLAEPVPGVAPAIVLYMEQAARAGMVELTLGDGKDGGKHAPPFSKASVREIAFGAGVESLSLRFDPPLAVRASLLGRGLVLTLEARPGDTQAALYFSRGSVREFDAARALFEEAEASKRAGRLEEARRTYSRIGRDFAQDGAARERARQGEAAIAARAETALAEAAAIEGDIASLGAEALLESASARCRFVIEAFPDTTAAARAMDLKRRVEEKRVKYVGTARVERARELLKTGKKHLESGRYRLARLYLREVIARYGDLREIAVDAGREVELAEKQIGGA